MGVAVAIGWALESQALTQISPSLPNMKLNTALCLAAIGTAMALRPLGRAPRVTRMLAASALVLLLAILLEWIFGVSLGIDTLLVSDPLSSHAPGRPSPHTVVILSLMAGAMLAFDSRFQRLARVFAAASVALTLLVATAYLYNAGAVRGTSTTTGIALHTVVAFLLLAVGFLAMLIDRPPLAIVLSRGSAGQLARRLLPAALILPVLLGGIRLLGQDAGLYDTRYGLALFAWAMVVVFSLLLVVSTRAIDGREQAQRSAELARDQARVVVERFFEVSLDLMGIATAEGRFTQINPTFERTLGYSFEEFTSEPFLNFVHPDDLEITQNAFAALKGGSDVVGFENRYRCKDGSYRWLLWSASAMTDGLTHAAGRDVTERKEMEDALRLSREQAVEASRLKSEFVASMSHELRTPLNGVIGMTDLLRDTDLSQIQREYVNALDSSGQALMAVIGDVLDFSKLEAGRLELERIDFDVRSAVEEACQTVADQAHAKGLEIAHWVDGRVPATVSGDRSRLRQVLLNLLSNAIKFTAAGEVTLRLEPGAADQLLFSVLDTGIGIDEEQAPKLFEAFAQADQSTTRRYGGTGLGLAISCRLVELMGGQIGGERREGGGSRFWFSADLPEGDRVPGAVRSAQDLQGLRTLVVDDNATNRRILEHYLRSWGAACESVDRPSSAIEALERATRAGHPFELALLDFNMPQMNGLELADELEKRPALDLLKIVVLSSAMLASERFEPGRVAAVLKKPAGQSDIYDAILRAVAGSPPRQKPATATQADPPVAGLSVLLAEDNEINQAVAVAVLGKLGIAVEIAQNGREAVEMAAATAYDAILMDCQMPEVNGFEATRQIRAAESSRHVPIIAMTALSMPGDRERCLAAGMDDYLSKPVRRSLLESTLHRHLRGAAKTANGTLNGTRGAELPPIGTAAEILDPPTIAQLRESLTPATRLELVQTFHDQQERCLADIGNALERGDRGEVRRVAHLLKGSSASLGAIKLRGCCERFEHIGRSQDAEVDERQLADLRLAATQAARALEHALAS